MNCWGARVSGWLAQHRLSEPQHRPAVMLYGAAATFFRMKM
jgi:hypothetical protein